MTAPIVRQPTQISRWGDNDEARFIEGLGTHTLGHVTPIETASLLMAYVSSLSKRQRWGELHPDKARKVAMMRITEIQKELRAAK